MEASTDIVDYQASEETSEDGQQEEKRSSKASEQQQSLVSGEAVFEQAEASLESGTGDSKKAEGLEETSTREEAASAASAMASAKDGCAIKDEKEAGAAQDEASLSVDELPRYGIASFCCVKVMAVAFYWTQRHTVANHRRAPVSCSSVALTEMRRVLDHSLLDRSCGVCVLFFSSLWCAWCLLCVSCFPPPRYRSSLEKVFLWEQKGCLADYASEMDPRKIPWIRLYGIGFPRRQGTRGFQRKTGRRTSRWMQRLGESSTLPRGLSSGFYVPIWYLLMFLPGSMWLPLET